MIRNVREDVEDRVSDILAGFVNTGATNGLLLGRLLTVGTNNALTPGTGAALAIDIYGMTTGTVCEVYIKDSSGNQTQLTSGGKIPTASLDLVTLFGQVYPIGCIYTTTVSTNPGTVFGVGTWAAFGQGRVLLGDDGATYIAANTGGSATHTLVEAEIPAHTHNTGLSDNTQGGNNQRFTRLDTTGSEWLTDATGGGGAHNNLQPYLVVYFFKRTA